MADKEIKQEPVQVQPQQPVAQPAQQEVPMTAEEQQRDHATAIEEYYNIAYAQERRRLNEMFGKIKYPGRIVDVDEDEKKEPIVKTEVVYKEPDLSQYVPAKKYKKKKGALIAFGVLFGVAIAVAIVLALHSFGVITLPIPTL